MQKFRHPSLYRVNTYKSLNSGIPFAAAPVKNLRFMPPVTVSPWKEVLDTNQFQPVCPQVNQCQPVFPQVNQFYSVSTSLFTYVN